MTFLFYLIVIVGAIVFQVSVTEYFHTWTSARPDAMLLVTVHIGMRRGVESGLTSGFILGLLQDILTGGLLGANSLSKGLLGYFIGGLARNIARRTWTFLVFLIFGVREMWLASCEPTDRLAKFCSAKNHQIFQ